MLILTAPGWRTLHHTITWRFALDTFKWSAQYAAAGIPVVVCHGCVEGRCTCKSPECPTPGKHPVLKGWQKRATADEDELAEWFDGRRPYNVGLLMGERSGIVDIEYDTEEGRLSAERFGLDKLYTPTFTSRRSTHRLVKWDARLPQQAVFKLQGLEIRIGGGKRGAQSIAPPSVHASGASYAWVEGMAITDCEIAEMPRDLMVAICNAASFGDEVADGPVREPATKILHKKVGEGDRHDSLVRIAARMAINMANPWDAQEQQDLLAILRSLNLTQCDPSKSSKEVEDIWRHELAWACKKRSEGVVVGTESNEALNRHMEAPGDDKPVEPSAFSYSGLQFREGEWWPGQWTLAVVHGDPVIYRLSLPVYRRDDKNTVTVTVNLDVETYRSSALVAAAVLAATHTVLLDEVPEQWAEIWNGRAKRKNAPAIRALKAKLLDIATHEPATAENCRFAAVATWLLDVLSMVPRPSLEQADEYQQPDVTGMPAWVFRDGEFEMWFSWTKAWEMVDRGRRRLEEGDRTTLRQMILAATGHTKMLTGRSLGENGMLRRYIRFPADWMHALQEIAAGDFSSRLGTPFAIWNDPGKPSPAGIESNQGDHEST